jgi:phasin family protein
MAEDKMGQEVRWATGNGFGAMASAVECALRALDAASKKMQAVAGECFETSNQSCEHATQALEKLRSARSLDEVVKIHTNFAKEAVEDATWRGRKFGELMAAFPSEITKTYQDAWLKSVDAAVQAMQHAGQTATENVVIYSEAVKKSATVFEHRQSA